MAARPDLRDQHDDGSSLARLEARLGAVIGDTVGRLIAEENAIDNDFCRLLAAATDECAGLAEQIGDPRRGEDSYFYQINGATYNWRLTSDYIIHEQSVIVFVGLYDNGDVRVAWRHPAPHLGKGFQFVQVHTDVRTRNLSKLYLVNCEDAGPMIADTARRLLTLIRDAWHDYRDAQTAAYLKAD